MRKLDYFGYVLTYSLFLMSAFYLVYLMYHGSFSILFLFITSGLFYVLRKFKDRVYPKEQSKFRRRFRRFGE